MWKKTTPLDRFFFFAILNPTNKKITVSAVRTVMTPTIPLSTAQSDGQACFLNQWMEKKIIELTPTTMQSFPIACPAVFFDESRDAFMLKLISALL